MISPGALVTVKAFGTRLWIVKGPGPNGSGRWHLTCKVTDQRGRTAYHAHLAGSSDITLVKPAPTYDVGTTIEHGGLTCTVVEDKDDTLQLSKPARSSSRLKGGGKLRIVAGNVEASKTDVILEALK